MRGEQVSTPDVRQHTTYNFAVMPWTSSVSTATAAAVWS